MFNISKLPGSIDIGYVGETNFRTIEIDMTPWMESNPDGVPSIVCIRPKEKKADAYVAATTFENNVLSWTITAGDIGSHEGTGEIQIWLEEEENETVNKRGKSVKVKTIVHDSASDPDGEVPAAQQAVLEQMTQLKNETVSAAEDAEDAKDAAEQAAADAEAVILHPAYINTTNKHWMVYDDTTHQYVDTEILAEGTNGAPGQDATPNLITKGYSDLTFPVTKDTLCYHSGVLYKAKQDISTSEAWTAAHWDETTIEAEQRLLKNAIAGINSKRDVITNVIPNDYYCKEFVTPQITADKAVIDGEDVSTTGYNIAEFTAEKDFAYNIYAKSGELYDDITLVQLKNENNVVGNYKATQNTSNILFVAEFAGTVRISYKNEDSYSLIISKMDKGTELKCIEVQKQNKTINSAGKELDKTVGDYCITKPIELNVNESIVGKVYQTTNMSILCETDERLSYYKPVIVASESGAVNVMFVADRRMRVCLCGTISSLQSVRIITKKTITHNIDVEWWKALCISRVGGFIDKNSNDIKMSKPIRVKSGDIVKINGKLPSNVSCIAWTNQKIINTYSGVPSYIPLTESNGSERIGEDTAIVYQDGYVVVSAYTNYQYSVQIERTVESQREEDTRKSMEESVYGQMKNNYVDKHDFVPNLEKKRTNAIMTYKADDKKISNYIVNAVAYPNGEIIACRAGGQVVKIANDGTETVLMTIANAQDWRGVFMDSNLNVYVSPHSATFSTQITNTDRGLYRLAYGSNTFTKVISLCHDVFIPKWQPNTTYAKNNKVFNNEDNKFYYCKTAHTSGETFELEKWTAAYWWAENTSYPVDKVIRHNGRYYCCTTAHTSGETFDSSKFNAATEFVDNDDTIWTMCEDAEGRLYAGVYAHSMRDNPAVYRSSDNGVTWEYAYNFVTNDSMNDDNYGTNVRHVHCINYNEYDRCLYAAVGEVNTIMKSSDASETWVDLHISCAYGQPTYVIGVKDGLLIGSDGHYSCGVSKLLTDGKTLKPCGRTAPGFIFNIRRSDVTGWLYAFTKIDNYNGDITKMPPVEAITSAAALEAWKTDANTNKKYLKEWEDYNEWASVYYPEDAIRPMHTVMMVSRDEGDTWEVFKTMECGQNNSLISGFMTVGYFRDGECLVGCCLPIENTTSDKEFVKPYIISEGKKKRTSSGFDLTGEIFIKTNTSATVAYE